MTDNIDTLPNTYLEKFNYYHRIFLNELINIFPEFSDSINLNYSDFLSNKEYSNNDLVKEYIKNVSPYINDISQKNDKFLKGLDKVVIIRDIDFRDIWSRDISDNTRENIWKYLQTLVVLGRKIVSDDDDISKMLQEFNSETDLKSKQKEMIDMIENMGKINTEQSNSDGEIGEIGGIGGMEGLFNNGIISDIAKELTDELDLDKMNLGNPNNMNEAIGNLMGGEGGGNFFNLINKVGQKIQKKVENGQINQNDLFQEAQKMMGGLKNPEKLAKSMMKNKGPKESTKERLRRKLKERQDKQKNESGESIESIESSESSESK